jgi:molybdate transport system substrate-binding protein
MLPSMNKLPWLTAALCLCAIAILAAVAARAQERITVATAANMNLAMREIVPAFASESRIQAQPIFGSSGNFYSQIRNGAPFDVFVSADTEYPERLARDGLVSGPVVRYARGSLVLWTPNRLGLDPAQLGMKLLLRPEVRKIAMANPAHAPYGRAAEAALRASGIYETVKTKLVLGEDITQTFQFVESGNAQAGLVALALVVNPTAQKEGRYSPVPDTLYPPLEQGVVVLKSSVHAEAGHRFVEFLASPRGRAILARYGFRASAGEGGK